MGSRLVWSWAKGGRLPNAARENESEVKPGCKALQEVPTLSERHLYRVMSALLYRATQTPQRRNSPPLKGHCFPLGFAGPMLHGAKSLITLILGYL
jgi:hypothetical protein